MIDVNVGLFFEMNDVVEKFCRGLYYGVVCKVVWFNELIGWGSERGDVCCLKFLYGLCFNWVLKMLFEFGGIVLRELLLLRYIFVVILLEGIMSCEI